MGWIERRFDLIVTGSSKKTPRYDDERFRVKSEGNSTSNPRKIEGSIDSPGKGVRKVAKSTICSATSPLFLLRGVVKLQIADWKFSGYDHPAFHRLLALLTLSGRLITRDRRWPTTHLVRNFPNKSLSPRVVTCASNPSNLLLAYLSARFHTRSVSLFLSFSPDISND